MFRRVYTYKLRANRQQRERLSVTLESCRNLYNCALEQRKMQRTNVYEQKRQLVELKDAFSEYRGVHAQVLLNVMFRLDRSFQNFFPRQRCPACGKIKKKPLSERMHRCECGSEMHRDFTSALVLLGRIAPLGANVEALSSCVA